MHHLRVHKSDNPSDEQGITEYDVDDKNHEEVEEEDEDNIHCTVQI